MFFLRSIVLAAAAFATVASAIPAGVIPSKGGETGGTDASSLAGGAGTGGIPGLGQLQVIPVKRGQSKSLGDVIKKCHEDMAAIIDETKTACKCEVSCKDGKPDVELVVALLVKISVLLDDLLRDLKVFVIAELKINGVVCTLHQLAEVIAGLLSIVIELVYLVLFTLGPVVGLLEVIAKIGACLCDTLRLLFHLLPGLKAEIAVLIKEYVAHCQYVKYSEFLTLLGIQV